jgi:hypothetical protein
MMATDSITPEQIQALLERLVGFAATLESADQELLGRIVLAAAAGGGDDVGGFAYAQQEMSMISLQGIVGQRSTSLSLTSSLLQSLNGGTRTVAGNIGR